MTGHWFHLKEVNNMTQRNLALNPSPNKTAMNKEQS